jgi:hypothetical protein
MPVYDLLNPLAYLKDQNVYNERILICNSCPEQKFNKIARKRQCSKCKCFTDLKGMIAREKCPIGKWKPVIQ